MPLSLHVLPINIIYGIFDHLTPQQLFMSTANVSRRLNAILNSYQPFQVNLTNIITYQQYNATKLMYSRI